jgi:hypothetical protein
MNSFTKSFHSLCWNCCPHWTNHLFHLSHRWLGIRKAFSSPWSRRKRESYNVTICAKHKWSQSQNNPTKIGSNLKMRMHTIILAFFLKKNYFGFSKSFAHNQSLLQFFQATKIKPKLSKSKQIKCAINYVSILLKDYHSCLAKISIVMVSSVRHAHFSSCLKRFYCIVLQNRV